MNFVLIPSEAGMRQHKFTWIVVIKIFVTDLPSQPFLGHHLYFTTFFTLAILHSATFFFTAWLLLSEYISSKLKRIHTRGCTNIANWCHQQNGNSYKVKLSIAQLTIGLTAFHICHCPGKHKIMLKGFTWLYRWPTSYSNQPGIQMW